MKSDGHKRQQQHQTISNTCRDWELTLLVDVHEWSGNKKIQQSYHSLLRRRLNCAVSVQPLPIEDYYLWLAKQKKTGESFVIDTLVERKTTNNIVVSHMNICIRCSPKTQLEVQLYKMKNSDLVNLFLLHEEGCLTNNTHLRITRSQLKEIRRNGKVYIVNISNIGRIPSAG